jgi:hypothetical protein
VREQAQGRAGLLAVEPGDQVRALVRAAEQLALEAGRAHVGGQVLLRGALVAGRVDGVEADQPAQQLDGFVAKRLVHC